MERALGIGLRIKAASEKQERVPQFLGFHKTLLGRHTVPVEDLVIVHSPDATLVCKRRDATAIKELVDNVRSEYEDEYL